MNLFFILLSFATRAGVSPITVGPYYLTYPVNFPCGMKPFPVVPWRKPTTFSNFRHSVDLWLFLHEDWVGVILKNNQIRIEPAWKASNLTTSPLNSTYSAKLNVFQLHLCYIFDLTYSALLDSRTLKSSLSKSCISAFGRHVDTCINLEMFLTSSFLAIQGAVGEWEQSDETLDVTQVPPKDNPILGHIIQKLFNIISPPEVWKEFANNILVLVILWAFVDVMCTVQVMHVYRWLWLYYHRIVSVTLLPCSGNTGGQKTIQGSKQ